MAAGTAEGKGDGRKTRQLSKGRPLGIGARRMPRVHDATVPVRVGARPHPVYFAGTLGWIAFVAFVATLIIRHNELSAAANWAVVGWASLAAASGIVGPALRWARTTIEVDAVGARCATGILWRSTVDVAHESAREIAIEQSWLGRTLDYGRLRIVDATGTTYVLPPVGNVAAWRAALPHRDRCAMGRRG
jgi:hypothetical protein